MHVHQEWLLTPERTAVHWPTATGVIADLHLGYSEARRQDGEAVPGSNLEELLLPLATAVSAYGLRRLVIAGDLFETALGAALVAELVGRLSELRVELVGVVPGNHDRRVQGPFGRLTWCPDAFRLGAWQVVHGDGELPAGKVMHGHFHPCVRLGGGLAAPCYLSGPNRLVLPAYSPDARGVNVLGAGAWRGYRCHAVAGDEVIDLGVVADLRRLGRAAGRR
jgi:putative SbcD/Mre11-related phosphoesterase